MKKLKANSNSADNESTTKNIIVETEDEVAEDIEVNIDVAADPREETELKFAVAALNQSRMQRLLEKEFFDTKLNDEMQARKLERSHYRSQLEALQLQHNQKQKLFLTEQNRLNIKITHLEKMLMQQQQKIIHEQQRMEKSLAYFKDRLAAYYGIYQSSLVKLADENNSNIEKCKQQTDKITNLEVELNRFKVELSCNNTMREQTLILERAAFMFLLQQLWLGGEQQQDSGILLQELRTLVSQQKRLYKKHDLSEQSLQQLATELVTKLKKKPLDFINALTEFEQNQQNVLQQGLEEIKSYQDQQLASIEFSHAELYKTKQEAQKLGVEILALKQELSNLLQTQKAEDIKNVFAKKINETSRDLQAEQLKDTSLALSIEQAAHREDISKLQQALTDEINNHLRDNTKANQVLSKIRQSHREQMLKLIKPPDKDKIH